MNILARQAVETLTEIRNKQTGKAEIAALEFAIIVIEDADMNYNDYSASMKSYEDDTEGS
jgi:hypothetical protein